jgi:hypothetical protein
MLVALGGLGKADPSGVGTDLRNGGGWIHQSPTCPETCRIRTAIEFSGY